jgi:hypothetical protein
MKFKFGNNRNFGKDLAIFCKSDKSSETFGKQPTQLIIELNLCYDVLFACKSQAYKARPLRNKLDHYF